MEETSDFLVQLTDVLLRILLEDINDLSFCRVDIALFCVISGLDIQRMISIRYHFGLLVINFVIQDH
jgi:hypothetical protein